MRRGLFACPASPALGVKSLKELPKPPALLTEDEVYPLLDEIPDHLRALVACVVYAGLRRMEVFHLRWVDIHLNTGTIDAVAREEHPTKNYETRSIPMTQALIAEFKRHPHCWGANSSFPTAPASPTIRSKNRCRKPSSALASTRRVTLHPLAPCLLQSRTHARHTATHRAKVDGA